MAIKNGNIKRNLCFYAYYPYCVLGCYYNFFYFYVMLILAFFLNLGDKR